MMKRITGKETPAPLQEYFSLKQNDLSRSPGHETVLNSGKRRRSDTDKDDIVSKRQRMMTNDEDSNICNVYQDNQYKNNFFRRLIGFMYQLDLSILCSLRKLTYEHKYPSLSLAFEDPEINKFSNIVLRYNNKSIYVQTENVDKFYIDNNINYDRLFPEAKQSNFSINNYFNSFVKHLISNLDNPLNNIEYLIIYTNSELDFTKEKKLKQRQSRDFYPFKFDNLNIEECDMLKDFLFINNNTKDSDFYQFLQDDTTRKELYKRLQFSLSAQKVLKERKLSRRKIKKYFLEKLVLAVNQPNRKELRNIIKNEIEKNREIQNGYIELQEKILRELTAPEKQRQLGKLVNYIPVTIYEFNLLILFLHKMCVHKNITAVNSEKTNQDESNYITIHYKDIVINIKVHTTNNNTDYSRLFSFKEWQEKKTLNKYFTFFTEESKKNIKYFIIYTNADLDLTEEKGLKEDQSRYFNPLNLKNEKYKILRYFSCINENNLYHFSKEKATRKKLLNLLNLPTFLQKEKAEGILSADNEKQIKEEFLDKLIIATNQLDNKRLKRIIKNEIRKDKLPYNYEELHEIALRWTESHDFGPITKEIIEKLLKDIENDKFSYQNIQNRNINEEIKFAKSVVGRDDTPVFNKFLDYLIEEEKLEILKKNGVNPSNMSSILNRAGTNAEKSFKDLYNLWFDAKGNKTQYLITLEKNGISLANMSTILSRSGAKSAKAFKNLYNLWFDEEGNKTQYLTTLEENGISLANISSVLIGGRANSPKAFKDLYHLWFDNEGNKTKYLKTLDKEKINLTSISSILNGAGTNAAIAYKELHNVFFDEQGKKTIYLKTLEIEGINLTTMSSILNGVGGKASKAFIDLYELWFDKQGRKSQYLIILEKEGVNLSNMSSILSKAGTKAPLAFSNLYNLWFDSQGNKTQYLKTLEKEKINLSRMSNILHGAGANAAKAFTDLHNLWFDEKGTKTQYLKTLENEGVSLISMSSILHGARANAAKTFKDLFDLWFDKQGRKTHYLKNLEKEGIALNNMSSILGGAGMKAPIAFKSLYNVWFDKEGNKTYYLNTLKREGVSLVNLSSITHGAGANAAKAFTSLYDLWFDKKGNKTHYLITLEKEGMNLINISSILNGSGANSSRALQELYNILFDEQGNKKQHLKHFIGTKDEENCFTLPNLSGILGGAGVNAKNAFKKFHNVCFDNKGEITELLDDFYTSGFKPRNLSSILCGTGVRASSVLKKLHSVCFNKRKTTQILNAFYKAGFRPSDLCSILSGAPDSLEKFYDFCFIAETKKYLNHFLEDTESFTMANLSEILHGAKSNICSAFKDFHDTCFDKKGNRTQILYDFYKARFTPTDLSSILSMAGNNAAAMFQNFYELCFNEKNYLTHFLAERNLFTPKNLSKILHRVGTNICSVFKKLHDVCFDVSGNRTDYLNKLIQNTPSSDILEIFQNI